MPSNAQYADLLDELKASIDPMDAATLFAGLRNSVPLSMLFRSGDTNVGHDEELAKRRGPATMPAPPTIDPAESNRRAQMDFEMQYPDPRIRELLIAEMLKQARDPYSPTTATRRRDFEEAPMSAQHYMSAAPKKRKFANGGAIDFSTPDMADGGRFIPDPQPYNKGGGVKKSLDEMMAEMAQKGVKVADKPDLARRGFLGLGKASDFPLAKLDTKALEKMQSDLKGAPAITEKSVTIDPGKGAAKSTLKSISETPMSRREVLQSAAGQAMRGVLPDLGGLNAIGNVAKVAETAAPAFTFDMVPALVAEAVRKGMSEDQAMAFIRGMMPAAEKRFRIDDMYDAYKNPEFFTSLEGKTGPGEVMRSMMGALPESLTGAPLSSIRPRIRAMQERAPEVYNQLRQTAKDIGEYGHEN
jgi:hypothetical protein